MASIGSIGSVAASSAMTHREFVDKWLALSVAATTLISFLTSVMWERSWGPRLLLRREMALNSEIDRLEREADGVCSTSKLYQHSQLMRAAVGLRHELLQERRKRYRYQLSVESMFSPLSTLHSVRRDFSAQQQHQQQQQSSGTVSQQTSSSRTKVSQCAPSSVSHFPVSADLAPLQRHVETSPATPGVAAAGCVWSLLRYNLLAVVKYVLRFGHIFVYLSVFGVRPGMMVMPPSIEDSAHFYVMEVVVPWFFDVAMYGPTSLFFAGPVLGVNGTGKLGGTINVSLAQLSGSGGDDVVDAFAAYTGRAAGAGAVSSTTVQVVTRYNVAHLCASNNLVWWFLCCLCASHCLVRVFAC